MCVLEGFILPKRTIVTDWPSDLKNFKFVIGHVSLDRG